MPAAAVRLTRSRDAAGGVVARLGVPLLDEYLEFLAGRCRPNTVLAVAYDLKVFFTVVAKPPRRIRPADVLAFMTAQPTGGEGRLQIAGQVRAGCRRGRCGRLAVAAGAGRRLGRSRPRTRARLAGSADSATPAPGLQDIHARDGDGHASLAEKWPAGQSADRN
jgi:hypothetical protein